MSFFQSLYHNFFVVFSCAGATASIPHAIVFVTVFFLRPSFHPSKNPAKNIYLRSTPTGLQYFDDNPHLSTHVHPLQGCLIG